MLVTPSSYDAVSFNVTNGTSDYDVRTNVANAFNNVPVYRRLEIRVDGRISIKLNKTTNPEIVIDVVDSPYVIPFDLEVSNLFVTNNSGQTVTIKLFGTS